MVARALGAWAVPAVLVLAATTSCASAPRDDAAYRADVVAALGAGLSEARAGELAARQWVGHRTTDAAARVVVAASESGLAGESGWLSGLQPPTPASDAVRADALDALDAASSALQDVRIRLSSEDRPGVVDALADLTRSTAAVEAMAEAGR